MKHIIWTRSGNIPSSSEIWKTWWKPWSRGSPRGVLLLDVGMKALFEWRMRNEGGGFPEIDDEVAAVLAFVISHTTFLVAQDDETGRCPKVVLSTSHLRLLPGCSSLFSNFRGWCGVSIGWSAAPTPFDPSERIEPAEPANRKLSTINKIFHFRYKWERKFAIIRWCLKCKNGLTIWKSCFLQKYSVI